MSKPAMQQKQPQFNDGNPHPFGPLVVTIQRNPAGNWDIEPSDPAQRGIINQRVATDLTAARSHKGESLQHEWTRRRHPTAPASPHFILHPHPPILIREGEDVIFRCDPPFAFDVWMGRDPDVDLEPPPNQGPNDPFGWGTRQPAPAGGAVPGRVQPPGPNGGPADQRFYKVVAWVQENPAPAPKRKVDPDGVCDR